MRDNSLSSAPRVGHSHEAIVSKGIEMPKGRGRPRGPAGTAEPRVIRDSGFADRLNKACDGHPHVPAMNMGRLSWVHRQFKERFKTAVSVESVRKWFSGESRPRPSYMSQLAQLLEVDEAWLSLGIKPDMTPRERKVRNAVVNGAVNVVAGFIQMGGGHPAFPTAGDKRAEENGVDLYAVIRGAQYAFHVSTAQEMAKGAYRFVVPREHSDVTVIGVITTGPLSCDFIELSPDLLERHESRKGGYAEIEVQAKDGNYASGKDKWPKITRFDSRLASDA